MRESEKWKWSRLVVSDSLRPHGLQPTRLLHPWDFPGRGTGVGCHCLLRDKRYFCQLVGKVFHFWLTRVEAFKCLCSPACKTLPVLVSPSKLITDLHVWGHSTRPLLCVPNLMEEQLPCWLISLTRPPLYTGFKKWNSKIMISCIHLAKAVKE